MKLLRLLSLGWLPLLLAATPAQPPADAMRLVESERAFAADAAALGIRDAFVKWLAPTSVVFHPGPIPARAFYQKLPSSRTLLAWSPWKAVMSASGDLGWTTGPWTIRSDSTQKSPQETGEYVTLWRRQADGQWRAAFDGGVSFALPPVTGAALATVTLAPTGRNASPLARRRSLYEADAAFAKTAAAAGVPAALAQHGAADLVVLRDGLRPLIGTAAAHDSLAAHEGTQEMMSLAQFVADAGDLGYTYGSWVHRDGARVDSTYYLHIWQHGRAKPWELALEFVQAVPKRKS